MTNAPISQIKDSGYVVHADDPATNYKNGCHFGTVAVIDNELEVLFASIPGPGRPATGLGNS